MKKIGSFMLLLLMCSIFCVSPFTKKVNAADKTETKTIYAMDNIVYKIALGENDEITSGVYPYYYKSESNINELYYRDGGGGISADVRGLKEKAQLWMGTTGNVIITLKNDYEITNLRFYYIAAARSNSAQLFCNNPSGGSSFYLCENSRTVLSKSGKTSNWSNQSKTSGLLYTQSTMTSAFDVREIKLESSSKDEDYSILGKQYFNFNIFDELNSTIKNLAAQSGLFVIASMKVKDASGKTYSINEYMVNKAEFSSVTPSLESKIFTFSEDGNSVASLEICDNISCHKKSSTEKEVYIKQVNSVAGLIHYDDSRTKANANKVYNRMDNFFQSNLRPVLMIAVGILFVVVGTTTGVTIVRSSDEPEVRRKSINKLIGLFIGALVIELVLLFYQDIVEVVGDYFLSE